MELAVVEVKKMAYLPERRSGDKQLQTRMPFRGIYRGHLLGILVADVSLEHQEHDEPTYLQTEELAP